MPAGWLCTTRPSRPAWSRSPPRHSEEYLVRAIRGLGLDPPAITVLADLYREARFSDHVMMESQRAVAEQSLRLLAGQLADQLAGRHTDPDTGAPARGCRAMRRLAAPATLLVTGAVLAALWVTNAGSVAFFSGGPGIDPSKPDGLNQNQLGLSRGRARPPQHGDPNAGLGLFEPARLRAARPLRRSPARVRRECHPEQPARPSRAADGGRPRPGRDRCVDRAGPSAAHHRAAAAGDPTGHPPQRHRGVLVGARDLGEDQRLPAGGF